MKRTGLVLMIGAVTALAALGAAAVAPAPGSSEIQQLKKEVAALRQRVASLEKRVSDGSVFVVPKGGPDRPDIIGPNRWFRRVPPDWRDFEFNGMTYYIVPCDSMHRRAGEAGEHVPADRLPLAPKTPVQPPKP
jgi:hypothetical protein